MTVLSILQELADNGVKVEFDLENGTITCNKQNFIEDGQLVMTELKANGKVYNLEGLEMLPKNDLPFWSLIEGVYIVNLSSVPSEISNQLKQWFKTKTLDELTDEEILTGLPRLRTQYYMNLLVVAHRNKIKWKGGWFWRSNKYKDLIILKSWIVSE